jgi:hypothetical protein
VDRDIETVVDGMEVVPLLAPDIAMLERAMKGGAQEFSYDESPLACGCDPATDYKCPEHRTEPA